MLGDFLRRCRLSVKAAVIAALLAGPLLSQVAPVAAEGTTFFVSRNGTNADGRSWATAWNELDQINWAAGAAGRHHR